MSLRAILAGLVARLPWQDLACPACGCRVEPEPDRWSEGFWCESCWWRRSAALICDASATRVLRVRSNGDGTVGLLLEEG